MTERILAGTSESYDAAIKFIDDIQQTTPPAHSVFALGASLDAANRRDATMITSA
jgi:hypothetical protein